MVLVLILSSWGYKGHKRISEKAPPAFPPSMYFLLGQFSTTLVDSASAADYRKDWDDTEAPKHYIDIDVYPEFLYTGKIRMSFDSMVNAYGLSYVLDYGVIPWATVTTYDSLKYCFARHDYTKAAMFAADLGHYVGDGHMPLHITLNFDGQNSGQDGVHSRYESKMINAYIDQIIYSVDSAMFIPNVQSYVFTYIYANYAYVDSVLLADRQATLLAGNTTSSVYNQALWDKTKNFTIRLFKNASFSLASLIYTAWVEAQNLAIEEDKSLTADLGKVYPNPAGEKVFIPVNIHHDNSRISLKLMDTRGRIFTLISGEKMSKGTFSYPLSLKGIQEGLYFCVLETDQGTDVKKIVVAH